MRDAILTYRVLDGSGVALSVKSTLEEDGLACLVGNCLTIPEPIKIRLILTTARPVRQQHKFGASAPANRSPSSSHHS